MRSIALEQTDTMTLVLDRLARVFLGISKAATSAFAGSPATDARATVAELKRGAEAAISGLEIDVDASVKVLCLELDFVEENLRIGNRAVGATRVFQALEDFQIAVVNALYSCRGTYLAAQERAIASWVDRGRDPIDLPSEFEPGAMGPGREFLSVVGRVLRKRYATVEARLTAARTALATYTGTNITWHLEVPAIDVLGTTNGVASTTVNFVNPSVDVIVVASEGKGANAARVHAGGRCGAHAEYMVRLSGPSFATIDYDQSVDQDNRWRREWTGNLDRTMLVTIGGTAGGWGVTRAVGAR